MRAHENNNCLTEMMFVEALERAKELDRRFEETGELVGRCELFCCCPVLAAESVD